MTIVFYERYSFIHGVIKTLNSSIEYLKKKRHWEFSDFHLTLAMKHLPTVHSNTHSFLRQHSLIWSSDTVKMQGLLLGTFLNFSKFRMPLNIILDSIVFSFTLWRVAVMWVCAFHSACVVVKRQLTGIDSLRLLCASWGPNSGCHSCKHL